LTFIRGLSRDELYPAGKQLIDSMVAKGWIVEQPHGRTYCRTPQGEAALKIILTLK
jgi:hypothetical protein